MSDSNNNSPIGAMLGVIFCLLVGVFIFGDCGGCLDGEDGKCDNAGCNKEATCTFGDMELCLDHYIIWSNKAHNNR